MLKTAAPALLCTVLLAACDQAPLPPRPESLPTLRLPTLEWRTADGRDPSYETPDLTFVVHHTREAPEDFVTLEVLNPKGRVYLTQQVPLAADGTATLVMPVRGTVIEDRAWTGTWTVQATYNHASQPFQVIPFTVNHTP